MLNMLSSRRLLAAVSWALAVCAAPAGAAVVSNVRHAAHGQAARVVIDVSSRARYEVQPVRNPDRIAINLPSVGLDKSLKTLSYPAGPVKRIRFNRLSWGGQIVLDLRGGKASWRDFRLSPVDDMPHRIVMDIGPPPGDPRPATQPATQPATPSHRRAAPKPTPYLVAIDAGHGGKDSGAIGKGRVYEKHEALAIARRLEREINSRPGFQAFLTRNSDVYLTLGHRAEIAREKGADVFVSVHLNTAPRSNARGSEVYFLSPAGAEATASRFLANERNAAKELGAGGASRSVLHMLVDVNQQSMLERSSRLALEILNALERPGLPPPRKVNQRSFAVLKSITMPSVIVETGFLTNSRDRAILTSDSGKDGIAKAIGDGIVSYFKKFPAPARRDARVVVHRVQRGDTLWKISRQYNTTVASIQRSNKLGSTKTIRIGQELVVREGHETY